MMPSSQMYKVSNLHFKFSKWQNPEMVKVMHFAKILKKTLVGYSID